MAWTCPNCGTKNEAGLFNFCKKCGTTPPRDSAGHAGSPTAQAADRAREKQQQARPQPHVVTSSSQQQQRATTVRRSSSGRRRRGGGGFIGVVVFVAIAAGLVLAVASRVDVGDTIRDLTSADTVPADTIGTEDLVQTGLSGDVTAAPGETGEPATAPETGTEPPTSSVAGPAVDPELEVAGAADRRCANRWNGRQNARARRAVVAAIAGGRAFAGVQLASATSTGGNGVGPNVQGQCIVIVGVQTDRSSTRIAPGDVYAEAGPVSGPRLPFVRLPTVSLSFAWNARVAKDGRIVAVRAQPAA
jgi:hypothetical protein